MTDVPPPESPKPPRGRPRRPKGYDDEAVLSEEEVQRRVAVRAGDSPRAPIERAAVRAPRTPPRPSNRTGARDGLLLIGLVIVGLVAVRLFLPDGPLTASATSSPSGTEAAVATVTASPAPIVTPPPTGVVITLPPTEFVPTPSPEPVTEAPPTPTPAPTPTLRPGQTPHPTPTPTKTPTPTPTPKPSVGPTPPGTAHVTVALSVINGDGGTATASSWTVSVSGGSASPSSFPGSASGTSVAITAGTSYSVSVSGVPAGQYAKSPSAGCSSGTGISANQTVQCTIVLNDIAPRITVFTDVDNSGGGALLASDFTVSVNGTNVKPGTTLTGNASGRDVTFRANTSISITQSGGGGDYERSPSNGVCYDDAGGLGLGAVATCTVTFTYVGPPPTGPNLGLVFPFLVLPWRPRRWRATRQG